MKPDTLVMKFGGASVASPEHFSRIADIILTRLDTFSRIIVVVSAMGDTTDHLIELARLVNPDPPRREYDMLVSVGERISISLLAMALAKKNKEAVSFTGSQSGIITTDVHSDARILEVRPHRLVPCLDAGKVVIVAGFQGVSKKGEITTLGRGGSDTTAVALAAAFRCKIEFYKDVPGIFSDDPKINSQAFMYPRLSYSQALDIVKKGCGVLHPRCVELAFKNSLPLHILSFLEKNEGTMIMPDLDKHLEVPVYEADSYPIS
jgi:aspartate kinase